MITLRINPFELARNIGRVAEISPEEQDVILEKANRDIPADVRSEVKERILGDVAGDKLIYEIAGLPWTGPIPKGVFITGIAKYLLAHPEAHTNTT